MSHAVAPREACQALELALWSGQVLPVRMRTSEGESTFWLPLRGRRQLADLVERWDQRYSAEVWLGMPRPRAGHGTASPVSVLWVATEGKDQAGKLRRFRPAPSIVLREGSSLRYVALWSLSRSMLWEDAVRANKRLAHAIGSKKKDADPDTFEFPAPGSVLRRDRKRPVVVAVAACDLDRHYAASQVVKRLRDAPSPDAWRERAA